MANFFKKNKPIHILSPMTGKIIPLEEVEDEAFSEKRLGDGIAIEITDGKVIAPFDGEITSTYKANHCVAVRSKEGIELLIHIGLETIKLKGEGFKQHVVLMQQVKQGDVILEADLEFLKDKGKSLVSPVVIANTGRVKSIEKAEGNVEKGVSTIMTVTMHKSKY
ncbi:PTS sugar transporter subunit IIA [Tepidimicrobium xylanilyticum]|uniref:PTS system, glucose-specific IIA component n=1 Tax=Tepidimicrobium xylanilyticum TaxID=1123352 RepID=A0A1H3DZR9_9FIRM|nr:PTS glucose transporter subunit IIA [Tepidimicrobium xylanilyticum]GMG97030.1 PTS glucose transporter subunit IIA [Tepidimicrobium xylanilyticum]SDX71943.1 PTS system, glucose-specific IIA component [Tepidimicrobium xylanilyticum]